MRTYQCNRTTSETDISLELNLDGKGVSSVETGCGFLDHMLTLFAKHGRFDLTLSCKGDIQVDDHHTVEDVGIVLGTAFKSALGDKKGIIRYGNMILPMDEALILSAVDISGRGGCYYALEIPTEKVGTFDTQLCKEFWIAFATNAGITLHIRQAAGENSHHIIEGAFKSVARSLKEAVAIDPAFAEEVPSTKGMLA
ncbi:MAG: imidazoleglycerol-phosphate dehydratase HisB [Clostridia bacterium]|jgi:imidazoleglycerol-phosphate dehydratase|nr:imidazoleglycerol-phosphate dehydratase HisB [Clostridia bacterium]